MSLTDDLHPIPEVEPREGFHRHHRQKDRSDNTPANVMYVGPKLHEWIETHPEAARELGWWVDSWQDPKTVPVTIPDELPLKRNANKRKDDPEKPRPKATVGIKVPSDARENGAEILQTLIEECRQAIKEHLGYQDDVPAYFVLVSVLYAWLKGHNIETNVEDVPRR